MRCKIGSQHLMDILTGRISLRDLYAYDNHKDECSECRPRPVETLNLPEFEDD